MPNHDAHLLDTLQLPSRYEPLVKLIGPEVLNLLVSPTRTTLDLLEETGEAIGSLGEGLFAPVFAQPGTGKTTLVENLSVFLPGMFTKTLTYNGALTSAEMAATLSRFIRDDLQQNDQRVIPMNVDHREDRPPSREEMSEIKRFLRAGLGQRVLLAWPGTMLDTAERMAEDYRRISGVVPVALPITVEGPQTTGGCRWLRRHCS